MDPVNQNTDSVDQPTEGETSSQWPSLARGMSVQGRFKKKNKRKKRRYSSRYKHLQKLERRNTKSSRKMVRAIDKGIGTYMKRRDKSARKKKDGALKKLNKNIGKGIKKSLKKGGKTLLKSGTSRTNIKLRKKAMKKMGGKKSKRLIFF